MEFRVQGAPCPETFKIWGFGFRARVVRFEVWGVSEAYCRLIYCCLVYHAERHSARDDRGLVHRQRPLRVARHQLRLGLVFRVGFGIKGFPDS